MPTELDKRQERLLRTANDARQWMQLMFYRLVELKVYDRNGPADRAMNQLKHAISFYEEELANLKPSNGTW
ncbi:MAG TPA: hypothetical protein VD994_12785 [Prosthecobacter sp.]|nr:hypothetical protein [Prosthecobacter sp.]